MTHARIALGATLIAGLALGSAALAAPPLRPATPAATPTASQAPTATPTPLFIPTPLSPPLRPRYVFDVHVRYVNYPYSYASANNYVQCRVDSGPYFYGDELGRPLAKPSALPTAEASPPAVTYEASSLVVVDKSEHNTVPENPATLTYSCTLFSTNAAGAQVYFPNAAPVGPGSRLYVSGPLKANSSKINVLQLLVLDGDGATPVPGPKPRLTPSPGPSPTYTPPVR